MIKEVLRRLDIDDKRFAPPALLTFIGQRKDELGGPGHRQPPGGQLLGGTRGPGVRGLPAGPGRERRGRLRRPPARVVFLFEQHPDVLDRYQRRCRYILVDEYQDTNRAQYRLCALLAAKHHNLCVVGDDDQRIYRWRGADIRNILDFEHDCRRPRSSSSSRTTDRPRPSWMPPTRSCRGTRGGRTRSSGPIGVPALAIQVFDAYNEYEEAEFVARQVERSPRPRTADGGGRQC